MWYCPNCDSILDEDQIHNDSDNEIGCGLCGGFVEVYLDNNNRIIENHDEIEPEQSSRKINKNKKLNSANPKQRVDDYTSLVDEYFSLLEKEKEISSRKSQISNILYKIYENQMINKFEGANSALAIEDYISVHFIPKKKNELILFLKNQNLYDKYSTVNYQKIKFDIVNKSITRDVTSFAEVELAHRIKTIKK